MAPDGEMTIFHLFYIPAILSVGVFIGMWLGKRNVYARLAEQERQAREREQRRAAREAKEQGASS